MIRHPCMLLDNHSSKSGQHPSPYIVTEFFPSCDNFSDGLFWRLSNVQYSILTRVARQDITALVTYLFYNEMFVCFALLCPLHPPPLPLATTNLVSVSMTFFFGFIFILGVGNSLFQEIFLLQLVYSVLLISTESEVTQSYICVCVFFFSLFVCFRFHV